MESLFRATEAVTPSKKNFSKKFKRERVAYAFLIVPILWWCVFFLYAFIRAVYFSFTDLRFSVNQISTFDFDNYIRLFRDASFGKALANTGIWTAVMTLFNNLFGLLVAWLVFRLTKGKKLFLALLFWPTLVSAVAGAYVTKLLFNPSDTGVINSLIIGMGGSPLGWYNDPSISLVTLMIVPSLLGFSTQMMIFYVAIAGVPPAYVEAARLETESQAIILVKIYVPLIRNAFTYNVLLSLIGNLKVMAPMQLVSDGGKGGPLDSTLTVMLLLYNAGITGYEMGYACAIGVVTLLIILLFSCIQLVFFGKRGADYE